MKLEEIFERYLENDSSAFFYTPPIYRNSFSFVFIKPSEIITVKNPGELSKALDAIDVQYKNGRTGYGYIKYETGYLLEKKLSRFYETDNLPLIKFCFFEKKNIKIIKSSGIDFTSGGFEKNYEINSFKINTTKREFVKNIHQIKNQIAEGNTYQVNYTVKGKFKFTGNYIQLFKNLVFNQSASYTAFINNGGEIVISMSPELFFSLRGNEIITRPMKGTIKRGLNISDDLLREKILKQGDKTRAENIMIVDLLRNDFGKISRFNSVTAEKIFKIEKYESLFQMVSDVKATLKPGANLKEIITNVFPCGSITGAPKIKTMEIINSLEKEKRGIYTGAIGIVGKDKCVFNVAIRTIVINKKNMLGEIGMGSGIVADSDPGEEYEETLLKQKFLTRPDNYYELFETMLLENGKYFLLDEHVARLKSAAKYFLFIFNRAKIIKSLENLIAGTNHKKKYRVRLSLNKWGGVGITFSEYKPFSKKVSVIISRKTISCGNKFQYFKTTNRRVYNSEFNIYSAKGFFDLLFFNEKKHLAEGAISNIFIKKDGVWITPSLSCGILPGVYRDYFIKKKHGKVIESLITYDELVSADKIIMTNSLRGEVVVNRLYLSEHEFKEFK